MSVRFFALWRRPEFSAFRLGWLTGVWLSRWPRYGGYGGWSFAGSVYRGAWLLRFGPLVILWSRP